MNHFSLSLPVTLRIHQQQVQHFGGLDGVRDMDLLQSALGAPRQTWDYTQDIYQEAAQYCYSIANNHPFLDGNKRTSAACMLIFLIKNGIKPLMSNNELYDGVIAVTTNTMSRSELAILLKTHSLTIDRVAPTIQVG